MDTTENRIRFYRDLAARFRDGLIEHKLYLDPRFSLDDAAARLGVSRYDLSRAANGFLGMSFCRMVNELRIAEALRLMRSPGGRELKIRRIALLAGFSDRKNFMRVCKRITGMSPSELKTQLKYTDVGTTLERH